MRFISNYKRMNISYYKKQGRCETVLFCFFKVSNFFEVLLK
jgi:hypothetical protein